MRTLVLFFWVIVLGFTACKQKDRKLSASYSEISGFLKQSGITDPELIFFYVDKPRMPLPNVTCFDRFGVQLRTPPQCFGYIKEYISFLCDSIMPRALPNQALIQYLDSVKIMSAYDLIVDASQVGEYDYFLFIDFLAIPSEELQKTLRESVDTVNKSKKKIRLFLVHALSEKNAVYFKNTPQ
ncbi:MAG: hypothetical protein NTW29_18600 [Bacteroidetes bacterium]|nr:hypothetical protein [Bacteroidota bacterium]